MCMTEPDLTQMEQQLAALQEAIAAKRTQEGSDTAAPYERGEVHAAIGEQIQAAVPSASPVAQTAAPGADVPSWQNPALAATVQQLVQVAFTQGVGVAIESAVKSGNAALVDALHDVLADEMHAELIARQKIAPAV